MINLNPQAGKKQLISGYFCLPRINTFTLIRQVNPTLLSYLILAISVADWDSNKHRLGFIRYSSRELADFFGLSHITLQRNFRKLKELGWLELIKVKEKQAYRVNNYKIYSPRGAQELAKQIAEMNKNDKDEVIEDFLSDKKISQIKQICSRIQTSESDSFKCSFKDSSNASSNRIINKLTDKEINDINSSVPF